MYRIFKLKNKKGFSLLETLVYMAILAITLVAVVNIIIMIVNSYSDLKVSKTINSSASSVLERMSREIRWAYDIDDIQGVYDVSPGRLVLKTKDSLGTDTTIEFYVENNILKIKEGGVEKGALTQSGVGVANLVFRRVELGRSRMIKIEMVLSKENRDGVAKAENFYDSVVLRESY